MTDEQDRRHEDAVGSMTEEAAKLAAILQDWAEKSAAAGQAGTKGLGDLFGPDIATGAPECKACPVCRMIAAARELGPDFYTNLGTAVSGLVAAAAAAAGDARGGAGRPSSGGDPSEPRVHRVDLDESDDDGELAGGAYDE